MWGGLSASASLYETYQVIVIGAANGCEVATVAREGQGLDLHLNYTVHCIVHCLVHCIVQYIVHCIVQYIVHYTVQYIVQ